MMSNLTAEEEQGQVRKEVREEEAQDPQKEVRKLEEEERPEVKEAEKDRETVLDV